MRSQGFGLARYKVTRETGKSQCIRNVWGFGGGRRVEKRDEKKQEEGEMRLTE